MKPIHELLEELLTETASVIEGDERIEHNDLVALINTLDGVADELESALKTVRDRIDSLECKLDEIEGGSAEPVEQGR